MKYLYVVKIILCLVALSGVNCSPVSERNGTAADDIDGHSLIQLGRRLHRPLLTLLGLAIRNLHLCSEWTQWSSCDALGKNYFGSRTRTRKCATDTETDDGGRMTETDLDICEGFCPEQYNVTVNGFCLKLYVTAKNHDDAEAQCEQDGGYLINIESIMKYGDVVSVLKGYDATINIGGSRNDSSSMWEYRYGSADGYITWYNGYPTDESGILCLALSTNQRHWFSHSCSSKSSFMCEITE